MVWLHVQYHSENNYYWEPGASTYNYDHELNTDKVSVSIVQDGITYAEAKYFAKCGNNAQNQFRKEYTWTED